MVVTAGEGDRSALGSDALRPEGPGAAGDRSGGSAVKTEGPEGSTPVFSPRKKRYIKTSMFVTQSTVYLSSLIFLFLLCCNC